MRKGSEKSHFQTTVRRFLGLIETKTNMALLDGGREESKNTENEGSREKKDSTHLERGTQMVIWMGHEHVTV